MYIFRTSPDWVQVSNNVKVTGNFVVLDLDPATWYHLRVTAHNNAGFTVAKYEFATLTAAGGKFCFHYRASSFLLANNRNNSNCKCHHYITSRTTHRITPRIGIAFRNLHLFSHIPGIIIHFIIVFISFTT